VGDTTESAAPALFERLPIVWQMAERRPQVSPYYRALATLRRAHPALARGATRWLRNADEDRVLSYERAGAGETLVIAVNLSTSSFAGNVDSAAGIYEDITPQPGSSERTSASAQGASRSASLPAVFLAPWEFRIFSRVSATH
jgi:glycosidase